MHISKEKLKSRLNVKFEPIGYHRYSVKKLQNLQKKSTPKEQIMQHIRPNRSVSQVRLPSLDKKVPKEKSILEKSQLITDKSIDLKDKIKSLKQIPKIKVQSKAPIHDTLTFLIKNQILSVPKIVGLLQKAHSDQFLYMRVVGMYEYEVCDEQSKGSTYITVSRNGMVLNGELVPLETLIREFQLYKKLKKISFFQNYSAIKCLDRWLKGSKKTRFFGNSKKISKLMNLQDPNILKWKTQISQLLTINKVGGWLQPDWIRPLSLSMFQMKRKVYERLVYYCFKMLEQFQLPLAPLVDIMNRVLGNLAALNMSFEKKIKIQRQIQKFYRLGRQTQFMFIHSAGFFINQHLKNIYQKIDITNSGYVSSLLEPLEQLDVFSQKYAQEKDKILNNSPNSFQIDFRVYIDPVERKLAIRPTPLDVYRDIMSTIQDFIKVMDEMNFRIIRTKQFQFVYRNAFKTQAQEINDKKALRQYTYAIPEYIQLSTELQVLLKFIQEDTVRRRLTLLHPFLKIHYQFCDVQVPFIPCILQEVFTEQKRIDQAKEFCDKIHDGESFMFGYLVLSELRKSILKAIGEYENRFHVSVPKNIHAAKVELNKKLLKHASVLEKGVNSPLSFISTSQQVEELEQKMTEYVFIADEIEKICDYFHNDFDINIKNCKEEKKKMNDIRIRMRSFKETKENDILKFRKELESRKNKLVKQVQEFNEKDDAFFQLSSKPEIIHEKVSVIKNHLKKIEEELFNLNQLESFFAMRLTIISVLEMLIVQYESLEQVWSIYMKTTQQMNLIKEEQVKKIDPEEFRKEYDIAVRKIEKYMKKDELAEVATFLFQSLTIFLQSLEVIQEMKSPHIRGKDVEAMNNLIQKQKNLEKGSIKCLELTLQKFQEYRIYELKADIMQASFKARKEIEILQSISQFQQWWANLRLDNEGMSGYPFVVIFGDNEKVRSEIQEFSTILLNILNHKYGAFVRIQCTKLLKKMNNLTEILQLVIVHQEKFLNLFPILTSQYVQKQLPSEYKKFENILNKTMKNIRNLIKPTQNLTQTSRVLLNNHIKQFDSIQRVLTHFLQKKRIKFQRFYFLPDDELLQVLVGIAGEGNIFRMFDGIKGWLTNEEGIKIGVKGVGGEELTLRGWVYKNAEPEVVFKTLEESIKNNLNSIVRNILYNYEIQMKQLRDLYQKVPWMCIYTVQLVLFTKQIQLNCFQNQIKFQTQKNLIQESLQYATLDPKKNSNYITLLLFLLHFTEELRRGDVHSVFDFQWHSFLKYYFERESVKMRALGGEHVWGGEYQGLWQLMVNTSDIRRAHACVLGNLKHGNGVLLQGPSGTGKTESLKQLARCMGKYCVLFNCSQGVSIRTLQKLLSGLCYTASWLCLDEINRLNIEIMSVVANQITTIKNAVNQKKEVFNFLGKDIVLRQGVGIFGTMNPIYLKRAKLTENLKSYFRVITVTMPDYEKILEVMLYGLGFSNPQDIAHKIDKLFQGMSVQLNPHAQYDFGLRAMKFLVHSLKQQQEQIKSENQNLIRAFYDVFGSRLHPEDIAMFNKVIEDAFNVKQNPYKKTNKNKKLEAITNSPQTGLIIFGPTSTKSALIDEYCHQFPDASIRKFNPSSVELKYFMGQAVYGRWQYGIVEKSARDSLQDLNRKTILILDSMLQSQTIENFNTLLDESKLLTLANGTRLKIHDNFKIIMETLHLQYTSPATITRCNLVYVSEHDIKKDDIIKRVLPQGLIQKDQVKRISKFFEKFTVKEILQIGNIYKILISDKLLHFREDWHENELLGLEKALVFSIRLLDKGDRIKDLLNKDNSFSLKKSVNWFMLSYKRYTEGEFLELVRNYEPTIYYNQLLIKTPELLFYQWINHEGIRKGYANILWKGPRMLGKTTCIQLSLENTKHFRIPLTNRMTSQQFIGCLQSKMLVKSDSIEEKKTKIIVVLDDLHLASEQSSEMLRFMLENKSFFETRTKQIMKIPNMIFIADQNKSVHSRLERHFTQMPAPVCEDYQIKNLYTYLIKYEIMDGNTSSSFKALVDIEIQKLAGFIQDFLMKRNQIFPDQKLGIFDLGNVFKKVHFLDQQNVKQTSDFIGFMFHCFRQNEKYLPQNAVQSLILLYHQNYKGKFQEQFNKCLKNQTIYSCNTDGTMIQVSKIQQMKAYACEVLENEGIDVSDFLVREAIDISNLLKDKWGHYCLIGEAGQGKKTVMRSACLLSKTKYEEYSPLNQKDMLKYYFQLLKTSFEQKITIGVIIDMNNTKCYDFVYLVEKLQSGFPPTSIFGADETDYAFSTIGQYLDRPYQKSSKTYDEICYDYFKYAVNGVRLLLTMNSESFNPGFFDETPTIKKTLLVRQLADFPTESIMEISNSIMEQKLKINEKPFSNLAKIPNLMLKIFHFLIKLVKQNKKDKLFHFKYNHLIHFKLIKSFCDHYEKAYERIKKGEDVMNRSIFKIHETNNILAELKEAIVKMEPEIKVKKDKIMDVVPVLQEKKRVSKEIKYYVKEEQKELDFKKQQIEVMILQVEEKLAEAQPVLKEANDTLSIIKRGDLSEIKNNMNPNPHTRFTMENMAILLGESQNWDTVKKILSDPNLMMKIKNCTPTAEASSKVRKRLDNAPDLSFSTLPKTVTATRCLYKWVLNIIKVGQLRRNVDLQKKKVDELKVQLVESEQKAKIKKFQLQQKESAIEEIEKQYQENKKQLNRLQGLLSTNKVRYENAEIIRRNLEKSMITWEQKLEYFKQIKTGLQSYTLELTLYLHIFPILSSQEQKIIRKQVTNTLSSFGFPVLKKLNLLNDVQDFYLDKETLQKLPHEDLQNPKITHLLYHLPDRPLLLDPDTQAIKWLEGQKTSSLQIVKQTFSNPFKTVEQALKNGSSLVLLIEDNITTFGEQILRVTEKEKLLKNRFLIEYNKNLVTVDENFQLILCCNSKTPNLDSKIYQNHQIINFQITKMSLKETLLKELLKVEDPRMSAQKIELQIEEKQNEMSLKMIQQRIISSLINNKKSLVDDDAFIHLLHQSQSRTEQLLQNRQEQSKKMEEVTLYLKTFDALADQAASIFMSLKVMSKMSRLLNWKVEVFVKYFTDAALSSISIQQEQEEESITMANEKYIENFDFGHYSAELSRPQSAFSIESAMTSRLASEEDHTEENQIEEHHHVPVNDFLAGNFTHTKEQMRGKLDQQRHKTIINKLINFLKAAFSQDERKVWGLLLAIGEGNKDEIKLLLSSADQKKSLKEMITQNLVSQGIKKYFQPIQGSLEAFAKTIISDKDILTKYQSKLSSIDLLQLCKIVSPERFSSLVSEIIKSKGYESILEYDSMNVGEWIQRSDSCHPILLVMGEDPIHSLTQFFGKKRYKNVIMMAMGEGQNKVAEAVLQKECRKENIVILHNLHISESFLPFLVKTLQQFSYRPPHKNFRLILISSIPPTFPTEITSSCHKYLIHQPPGLHNSIRYLYQNIQTLLHYTLPNEQKIIYSLAVLHSIVNQLRNYEPFGWNLTYDFTSSDFISAVQVVKEVAGGYLDLKNFQCNIEAEELQDIFIKDKVDFGGLKYLIGDISYIGKMADEIDRKKMGIFINRFLNPQILSKGFKFSFLKNLKMPQSFSSEDIQRSIREIPEHDPALFGLDESAKPTNQHPKHLLLKLQSLYFQGGKKLKEKQKEAPKKLQPIEHKFEFINNQIEKYNSSEVKKRQAGLLLRELNSATRIFNLKAFGNPRQFFVEVKMEAAWKLGVTYEKIKLSWSILPRENAYGICNVRVEAASVLNGVLSEGSGEDGISLYVSGVKKGQKQTTKKQVIIPLYANEIRSGTISSFGQNTNMLTKVVLETKESQEYWTLRGTAFTLM